MVMPPDAIGLTEEQVRAAVKPLVLDGWQYSVELESGRWVRWGEGVWREWSAFGGNVESPAAQVPVAAPEVKGCPVAGDSPFLEQCRAAGFELSGEVNQVGNVWATRADGSRWLLATWSESIIGPGLVARTLAEFGGLSITDESIISHPQPAARRFAERVDVQVSGRTVQPALFG